MVGFFAKTAATSRDAYLSAALGHRDADALRSTGLVATACPVIGPEQAKAL